MNDMAASDYGSSEAAPLLVNTFPDYSSQKDCEETNNPGESQTETDNNGVNNGEQKEEFKFSSLTGRNKLTLLLCALANLFSNTAFALPAPFYPEEAGKKDVSSTMIGVIFAVFQFVLFVASPILGNFLTRIGAKFMFVAGIFVGGCCSVLFGFLYMCPPGTPFIVTSLLCRSVEALGLAAFITASFAIISNEFPKHVGTVFGILETFSGLGLMLGPAIGGGLYEVGGFGLPFYVVGAVVLLNGILMFWTLPMPSDLSTERKVSIFKLFRSPLVLIILYDIVVAAIGISFLDPTFADHLKEFNLSTVYIGLIFVIAPGLYGLTAPIWGYFTDSKDVQAPLIVFGNLLCGFGYLLVGPSHWTPFIPTKLWVVVLGTVLIGLCFGCSVVPTMKCLVKGAFDVGFEDNLDTYGIVSGLFSTGFCFGGFIGPALGGILMDFIGFEKGVSIISVLHFSAMIISLIYFLVRQFKNSRAKVLSVQEDLVT